MEPLYEWVVRGSLLLVKVQTDRDDQVVLEEHCNFLQRVLGVVLTPRIRHLECDFTIDLRNFKNFEFYNDQKDKLSEEERLEVNDLKVTEELLSDQSGIVDISQTFAKFLETCSGLETFVPGLFLTDRSQSLTAEPHKMSLCFSCPQVSIQGTILTIMPS